MVLPAAAEHFSDLPARGLHILQAWGRHGCANATGGGGQPSSMSYELHVDGMRAVHAWDDDSHQTHLDIPCGKTAPWPYVFPLSSWLRL